MGLVDTLVNSIVSVVAGLLGFGMVIGGAQEATFGSGAIGTVAVLIGIVLLVFAVRI